MALSGKTSVTWASVFRLLILASHVRLPNLLSNLAKQYKLKGLILAQNERWRRGLGMQVEREVLD